MLNMAVNVHLVPVTGLTLPLISMGGSSIWFTSIAIGVVLSVSRYVDENEGKKKINEETKVKTPKAAVA
jgi:cell division protein FtsW